MNNTAQYIGDLMQAERVFTALYRQAKMLLNNGKKLTLELAEHKKKRTNDQNAFYWLFNGQLADFLNNSGLSYGEYQIPYTAEIIHDIQKKLYGIKTTTKMSVGEFCEYMNKLLIFWQEKTNGEFMLSELPESYLEKRGYIIK